MQQKVAKNNITQPSFDIYFKQSCKKDCCAKCGIETNTGFFEVRPGVYKLYCKECQKDGDD